MWHSPVEMVLFDPQQTHEFHKVEESCTFLCLQVAPTMLAGCFPAIRNIRTGGVCPGIYLSPDVFAQVQRGLLNVMRAYDWSAPRATSCAVPDTCTC